MTDWPKHADGSPKKMGEMTADERRAQFKLACQRLQAEFDHPAVQEKLAAVLNGTNVKQ